VSNNPFDDAETGRGRPANPFGDDDAPGGIDPGDAAAAIEHAASRIRRLKQQVGAEGLSLSATRELIDHLTRALDAAAAALRHRS
jgi:hypothetical protein